MAVDGSYKCTINSPMGSRDVTLTLNADGDKLSGTMEGQDGTQQFEGGTVSGNDVTWVMELTRPMPMKLECSGAVDGDAISGKVKLGAFGEATFSGSRV
ncbi:MAG: hypothetical protein O2780_21995 [Proteobacteria bacterium]|jgi:hypothetical protein|nr:hypothetical protein [Pseudomonadota bacterium]MDA1301084.1 hypothetical protein [Pseudomonadota bacterium]